MDPSLFRVEFRAMACSCEIVVAAANATEAESAMRLAVEEVNRIEQKYTRYKPTSIISRINLAAGKESIICDDETLSLLNFAETLFQQSDGLFDISSGVLRRAWDFKIPKIPSQDDIDSLLGLVSWPEIERENNEIKLPKEGMEIDFGGFGKEYATDKAVTVLIESGIKSGYVNLGGDLRVVGPKPSGNDWVMGIVDPRIKGKLIASIPVATGALATSGDYEKFFELKGQRYSHILSPRTGNSVNFWRSISILAPLSVTAGSYSTIAMLKEAEGIPWLENIGMAYFAIDHTGKVYQRESN
ncbi:MAG: FAD:protein FMN transferase [Methylococcaceae bacterium]|nr:FAD:protein FMN transferase [Methylococcaceae bacterium]